MNRFLLKNGSKGDIMVNKKTTNKADEFDIFSEPVPELSDDDVKPQGPLIVRSGFCHTWAKKTLEDSE